MFQFIRKLFGLWLLSVLIVFIVLTLLGPHLPNYEAKSIPLQKVFDEACGSFGPATSWALDNDYGALPLYDVTCRSGVIVEAADPNGS